MCEKNEKKNEKKLHVCAEGRLEDGRVRGGIRYGRRDIFLTINTLLKITIIFE